MIILMTLNREDYLLVIWEFLESFDRISEKELANRLRISPPTAYEYLTKLSEEGLIKKDGKKISFTTVGRNTARELVRMHRIAEVFAYNFLEIPWEETHASVMELEHIFSGKRGEILFKNLGKPETCPHGNPVDPEVRYKEVPLMLADDGQYTVKRVVFEDEALLKNLASINALPGTLLNVHRGDTLEVDNENGTLKVPHTVSMSLRLSRQSFLGSINY